MEALLWIWYASTVFCVCIISIPFSIAGPVRASSALRAPGYFCISTPRSDPFLERNGAPGSENR